jgi:release factor glutamine methyltransferase
MTIVDVPSRSVVSMMYIMRQELLAHYALRELESLIQIAFQEIAGLSRIDLMLNPEATLSEAQVEQFVEVIDRLRDHEPVQYIFGKSRFYGCELTVAPGVLIPRPETEELVHWIIRDESERNTPDILDIGTGSGCIAIALAQTLRGAKVSALDVSSEALKIARENAAANEVPVRFSDYNILDNGPHPMGDFDIIVSNPPYVTRAQMGDMKSNVLNYEPHLALFVADDDPLKFYRAIGNFSRKYLRKNGVLYLEINEDLATDTLDLLRNFNFTRTSVKKDLNGRYRMVKAMW